MMRRKLMPLVMSVAVLLNACTPLQLTDFKEALQEINSQIKASKKPGLLTRRPVTLTFLNRLDNRRSVPLSPSLIEKVVFDNIFTREALSYKESEGVKEKFPFIETGEHLVDITFKDIEEPVLIPVIIADDDSIEPLFYVINASLDQERKKVREISIGLDNDQDNQLDEDQDILRSQDGQHYLIHHPDGSVERWDSELNQDSNEKPLPGNSQPLPPGTNPQSGSTDKHPPQTATEAQPTRTIEFKIPKTNVPQPKTPDTKPLPLPPMP